MKRTFAGIIAGLLIGLAIPANAVKATPKPTPKPTATYTAEPVLMPQTYIQKFCMDDDLIYVIDNSDWNKTPNQFQVFPSHKYCIGNTADQIPRIPEG